MRTTAALFAAAATALLSGCSVPADEPTAVQPAESGSAGKSTAAKKVPIKLVAKRATAKRSVLSTGGALSCAKVTVTNQTKKQLEVNPLYFSLTDTGGTRHNADDALGDYEGQIDTTQLAPGEKATGMVCGKGKWTPKRVTMTNPLLDDAAVAEVS